jgi:UDP-N-acetylmuramate dehydrogenase
MQEKHDVELAPLTTLQLGGPARRLVEATTDDEVVEAVRTADEAGEPVLVLAGGSNVVIADEGFEGTVVKIATRGVDVDLDVGERPWITAAAGEPWDELVAGIVEEGLAGVECLAGIPGAAGATPIQNVGAYGQEVGETITSVRVYDRETKRVQQMSAADCGFRYRSSVFRGDPRWVVLAVDFELEQSQESRPISYAPVARALDVHVGARVPLASAREVVLELRRSKGMVIDERDPDTVSAGSFFKNPILQPARFEELEEQSADRLGPETRPPAWPESGAIKTSAAWLIEHSGFERGYGDGKVGLSTKHTLALVNRGGATTQELVAFAREIADGVERTFGVALEPEPVFVGHEWR